MVKDRNSKNGASTPQIMVSKEDAELIENLHLIVEAGNDVEVRGAKNGELKLLVIVKKVFKYN